MSFEWDDGQDLIILMNCIILLCIIYILLCIHTTSNDVAYEEIARVH